MRWTMEARREEDEVGPGSVVRVKKGASEGRSATATLKKTSVGSRGPDGSNDWFWTGG